MAFLEAAGLVKTYRAGREDIYVLRGLDLRVERGEMVAIVGASGVGKSTLLHVLGGLDKADAGTVRIGEIDLARLSDRDLVSFRNGHVGFVFQFHHLLRSFGARKCADAAAHRQAAPG